jgi:hypothetical protein
MVNNDSCACYSAGEMLSGTRSSKLMQIAPQFEGQNLNFTAAKIGALPTGWQTLYLFDYQVNLAHCLHF